MIAFLSKPSENEGFERIIDFLNANPIKYALIVNHIVYTSCIEQFWTTAKAKNINGEAQIHAKVDGKKVIISDASIRRDIRFGDKGGIDCFSNEVIFEQLILMGYEKLTQKLTFYKMRLSIRRWMTLWKATSTATRLDAEHDRGNIKIKRLEKKKRSRNYGLKRLYKVGLSARVESSTDEESLGKEDASKQGRIFDIDANQDIYLDLQGKENVVEKEVTGKDVSTVEEVNATSIVTSVTALTTTAATSPTISMYEITLAKALIEIKTSRPKAKGIVMQEKSETPTPTPIASSQQPSKVLDKGKRIMMEEPLKMKKKDQILFDEEVARKLQEEIYEQERLVGERARYEEEANSALIETWEAIQAKTDADYQLVERLQAEEQEQLTDTEKAKIFMEFLEKRRKLFAAKRVKEKRNRPPTKDQQRSLIKVVESSKNTEEITQEGCSKRAAYELE
nr:hypothetical protein [Tanacetum cinerariifolium]